MTTVVHEPQYAVVINGWVWQKEAEIKAFKRRFKELAANVLDE